MSHPFDHVTEAALRRRQSIKWRAFPEDVLPAWVAEMDYPLADPIRHVLHAAIDDSDCGYADAAGVAEAFAPWARSRWGWEVAPRDAVMVTDVVTGLVELLRVTTEAGDGVIVETPIYPPFVASVERLGRKVVEVPLRATEHGYEPDLDGLERAYAAGARVHLLCSPHNPSGMVLDRATLARIAELAAHHGVVVLSDEIHAPLTLPGAEHVPFPTVSEAAAQLSVVITSASKTWNLAGLKAAMMIASSDEMRAVLAKLPADTPHHAGHLGIVAARAAYREGDPWLARTLEILARNRTRLGELLAEHLPAVRWSPPQASYLAWLDCRGLGLGDDPARVFLDEGRVALSAGPTFGAPGLGFARLNIATTGTLLEEAVLRMARAVRAARP
ncbi:MAG: putative aminotransferase [Labilithrix sp.]|nr:putative aminotransferase [Labilithrix sp.]